MLIPYGKYVNPPSNVSRSATGDTPSAVSGGSDQAYKEYIFGAFGANLEKFDNCPFTYGPSQNLLALPKVGGGGVRQRLAPNYLKGVGKTSPHDSRLRRAINRLIPS